MAPETELVAAETEFGVLGPLLVRRAGAVIGVPAGKQRALLAALLLNAGRVVPVWELAEVLWGARPPASVQASIQNYVKRLRRAVDGGGDGRIGTASRGYVMRVEPGELDVARFEAGLGAARAAARRGEWELVAEELSQALAVWRGEPLADVHSELLAQREVPRLEELRLQAVELRVDAQLRLGRQGEVIAELRQLAAAHPLRERLHALLMIALYRDGQQGHALAAYQQARRVLVQELGAEPGPELRELHEQVLAGDPALAAVPAGDGHAGAAAGVRAGSGIPRQLPATAGQFAGRAAELAALTQTLDRHGAGAPGTVVISAIGGTAGVGKTTLALHWAHQVASQFPDGQLYANLRGYDPAGAPAAPETVIRGFLDALGVPPGQVPQDPQAQAGLYRSLLAGRKMLLVLDNAGDEQQVRPLLPASPGSLVLVTSRSQLGGLAAADGAQLISLDVLTQAEALQLLTARLGAARAAADPQALSQIARLCACLPLALGVAAARAAARPSFPLAAIADELHDSVSRLDVLDAGDPDSSVRAVFSWSARQLSPDAARMFRLLGIHPGPDISVPAAASLAGTSQPQARKLLAELARAHLTAEHLPGRYTFHDLLRAYAAEQARNTDSQAERDAAISRVLDHYLYTAASAAHLLNPTQESVSLPPPAPGAQAGQPTDHKQALGWLEHEHQVLLAAITLAYTIGADTHAWQLPWAMMPFQRARGHWQEWAESQRLALAAATRLGDTAGQAVSSRLLAAACFYLGDHRESSRLYAQSLTLYQRLGDNRGEARIQHSLGMLAEHQGRYADALGHAEQALHLYQAIGDKALQATALNNVGWCHGLLGDYQQASTFSRQALTLSEQVGDLGLEGSAWDNLGYAEHHLGNLTEAAACYQRALIACREDGNRLYEAETLTHLGDTRQAAGELVQARQAWQEALVILDDLQHPDASQLRAKLASADAFDITFDGRLSAGRK